MAELPDFLTTEHEAFKRLKPMWERNERRLRGGDDVPNRDLHRWHMEKGESTHLKDRRDRACYVNFPSEFMTQIRGHLDRKFPEPGHGLKYGSLGEVRTEPTTSETRAEVLHHNADGVGIDGRSYRDFWMETVEKAGATGHRWILSTLPPLTEAQRQRVNAGGTLSVEDERAGLRPFLDEYSPLAVPNWYYQHGVLQWIRFEFDDRTPRLGTDGKVTTEKRKIILFYVREGYDLFGSVVGLKGGKTGSYGEGGWWKYEGDGLLLDSGSLRGTKGQIPVVPLVVKPDSRDLSRPLTTELGQIAVASMNLDSAADHDAMVAGSRRLILVHADGTSQSVLAEQLEDGSLAVAIPEAPDQKFPIQVIDAAGTTANESLEKRIEQKVKTAERVALQEVTAGPQASGQSRRVEYAAKKSPLLAQIASRLETTMQTSTRFTQMLWGLAPDATVKWDREFDLIPLVEDIRSHFGLQKDGGMSSKTLKAELIVQDAEEKGLMPEGVDRETVLNELLESAELGTQGAGLLGSLGL